MEHQRLRSINGAPEESEARDGTRDALLHLSKARVVHGTPRDVIQGMKHCMKDQLRAHSKLNTLLQTVCRRSADPPMVSQLPNPLPNPYRPLLPTPLPTPSN